MSNFLTTLQALTFSPVGLTLAAIATLLLLPRVLIATLVRWDDYLQRRDLRHMHGPVIAPPLDPDFLARLHEQDAQVQRIRGQIAANHEAEAVRLRAELDDADALGRWLA